VTVKIRSSVVVTLLWQGVAGTCYESAAGYCTPPFVPGIRPRIEFPAGTPLASLFGMVITAIGQENSSSDKIGNFEWAVVQGSLSWDAPPPPSTSLRIRGGISENDSNPDLLPASA
jgi:hypothetical protein